MSSQNHKKSRRSFLATGIAGLAGATLISPNSSASETEKKTKRKLVHRTLGKTGIRVPVLSIGAQSSDPVLFRAAHESGVIHFDTANSYGRGKHEEFLGKFLKDRPRDSYVIATKVYMTTDQKTGLFPKDAKPEDFLAKFDESMGRLGLDYVDILYLHSVSRAESVRFEPYLSVMRKLKEEGRTRFLGVSTHTREPEVIHAAVDAKVYDVILTAYNFLQPHLKEMDAAIDRAAKAGLGIVAMKTQAGVYWDKERKKKINMTAALKWALKNENIHTSIPGMKSFEELEEDLIAAENPTLSSEEKADLKIGEQQKLTGLYCPQCDGCATECPHDLPVPTLMRSYMYAYGYQDLQAAKSAVRNLDLSKMSCTECDGCHITYCARGFDIREKIEDIIRIKNVPEEFLA